MEAKILAVLETEIELRLEKQLKRVLEVISAKCDIPISYLEKIVKAKQVPRLECEVKQTPQWPVCNNNQKDVWSDLVK